jgi:hypothetical protein
MIHLSHVYDTVTRYLHPFGMSAFVSLLTRQPHRDHQLIKHSQSGVNGSCREDRPHYGYDPSIHTIFVFEQKDNLNEFQVFLS